MLTGLLDVLAIYLSPELAYSQTGGSFIVRVEEEDISRTIWFRLQPQALCRLNTSNVVCPHANDHVLVFASQYYGFNSEIV